MISPKKRGLAILGAIIVGIAVLIAIATESRDYGPLRGQLQHLEDIEEVAWVEFDRNDVYVGFRSVPTDLIAVVNSAALRGNRALNFGVSVYAVQSPPAQRGWRLGQPGFLCWAAVRYGKFEHTCQEWQR